MKKLLLTVTAVAAAVVIPGASAGGWATVGLSSLPPSGLKAKQAWPVDITVLQHGQTPLSGVTPVVTIRDGGGDAVATFNGKPTGKPGVYHAVVSFPGEGTYSYEVYDGFGTYGGARTHTFKPVQIGAPGDTFPYLPLGLALALALGLAAATVVYLRRGREPAPVTNLREAAEETDALVGARRRVAGAGCGASRVHGDRRAQLDAETGPAGGQAVGRDDPRPPARPHADVQRQARGADP